MSNTLGRGLSSLIPPKVKKQDASADGEIKVIETITPEDKDKILRISPAQIKVNPHQPRQRFADYSLDELIESVRQYGIIQPLIVTRSVDGYELIAGERRLRASQSLSLKEVPVIVREAGEQEKLEIALIENLQRENLNPIETAIAYQKLIDEFSLTQEEVGRKVGKSRPVVTNALRLLNLPEEVQLALIEGKITDGHAKFILGLESLDKQMALFRRILHNNLTVRDTNQEARRMGGTKNARIKINYADKDKEFALREFFGSKVEIKRKGHGGEIVIEFFDDDGLAEIIEKVKR
ncbi:MAG: ParB/RepB/Spo0J family partition protein [Patescibacteria group bacterium]|nr:ParB/RepB/Spo0J family partition protein [Patescibacteria group bacterium]MDD4611108.1 ParB/RepB/Spo0J family partition protein [Patescibacteria group bacterium]